MRDWDRNHKGNLPVIKGIVWSHEKSLASFGCRFVKRGSAVRADPCPIIRKCSCDFVLTKQITERALPPSPDGWSLPGRHHWPPAPLRFLFRFISYLQFLSSCLISVAVLSRRLPSSSTFPPLSSSCFLSSLWLPVLPFGLQVCRLYFLLLSCQVSAPMLEKHFHIADFLSLLS